MTPAAMSAARIDAIEASYLICSPLDLAEPSPNNIHGRCCACAQQVAFPPPLTNLPKLCLDCAVAMTSRRH